MKKIINSNKAPKPIGPYSHSVKASGTFLYISGQIPLNINGELVGDEIKLQTKQVLNNIDAILNEAGLKADNVIKTTVLLENMNDFDAMNEVYSQYFSKSKPARAAYQVVKLPKEVLVEIETIAVFD